MPWNPDTGLWEDETSTDPTTSDVAVYDQELEDIARLERGMPEQQDQRRVANAIGGQRAEADYQNAPPQEIWDYNQGDSYTDEAHRREFDRAKAGEDSWTAKRDDVDYSLVPPLAQEPVQAPWGTGATPQFEKSGQFQPTEAYPFDPRILEQRQQEMAQPGFQRLPPTPPTDTLYFVNPHTGRNGYFDLPQGRQGQQIVQDYQRRGYAVSVNRPLDRQGNPIFTPQEQAAQAREQQMNLPFAQGDAHRLSQLEGQRAKILQDMGRGLRPRDAMPYLREIEHQIGMLHERQQRTQANNDKMQFQKQMQAARQQAAFDATTAAANADLSEKMGREYGKKIGSDLPWTYNLKTGKYELPDGYLEAKKLEAESRKKEKAEDRGEFPPQKFLPVIEAEIKSGMLRDKDGNMIDEKTADGNPNPVYRERIAQAMQQKKEQWDRERIEELKRGKSASAPQQAMPSQPPMQPPPQPPAIPAPQPGQLPTVKPAAVVPVDPKIVNAQHDSIIEIGKRMKSSGYSNGETADWLAAEVKAAGGNIANIADPKRRELAMEAKKVIDDFLEWEKKRPAAEQNPDAGAARGTGFIPPEGQRKVVMGQDRGAGSQDALPYEQQARGRNTTPTTQDQAQELAAMNRRLANLHARATDMSRSKAERDKIWDEYNDLRIQYAMTHDAFLRTLPQQTANRSRYGYAR